MHTLRVYLLIVLFLGIVNNVVSLGSPCYKEDFDNTFGLMDGTCDTKSEKFTLQKFDNDTDLPFPEYSNGYFIATNDKGQSCIQNARQFEIFASSTVELNILTKNPQNKYLTTLVIVLDGATSVGIKVDPVDNSAIWRKISFQVHRTVPNAKLQVQCDDLANNGAFLAIDYIKIRELDAEDCIDISPLRRLRSRLQQRRSQLQRRFGQRHKSEQQRRFRQRHRSQHSQQRDERRHWIPTITTTTTTTETEAEISTTT